MVCAPWQSRRAYAADAGYISEMIGKMQACADLKRQMAALQRAAICARLRLAWGQRPVSKRFGCVSPAAAPG
jgi:hypothetical protein